VRKFYSVSIFGYPIAGAGTNQFSQLAFTLSNGLSSVKHNMDPGLLL
jgi:methylmalonyl-CoA mutase N-terminal domain/subunit